MDSPRYALDRTDLIVFASFDPVVKITFTPQNDLQFTSLSGEVQQLPSSSGNAIDKFSRSTCKYFAIDGPSERICSVQLTYAHYYDKDFANLDPLLFHGLVTEPQLLEIVFITNMGRSSGAVRRKGVEVKGVGDSECTFILEAGEDEEIAGLYKFGNLWSTMFHGLLTRAKG